MEQRQIYYESRRSAQTVPSIFFSLSPPPPRHAAHTFCLQRSGSDDYAPRAATRRTNICSERRCHDGFQRWQERAPPLQPYRCRHAQRSPKPRQSSSYKESTAEGAHVNVADVYYVAAIARRRDCASSPRCSALYVLRLFENAAMHSFEYEGYAIFPLYLHACLIKCRSVSLFFADAASRDARELPAPA